MTKTAESMLVVSPCKRLGVGVLFGTKQLVCFPLMGCWMLEHARDETSLILRRDGRMLAFAKRHLHQTVSDALRVEKIPFGKKGRVQMGDGKARPIKHAFRRPVIECRVTLRFAPRGDLRQIHDRCNSRLFRGLSEVGCCLYEARSNGIDEIGSLNAFECGPNRHEIEKITHGDLCTSFL